MTAVSSFTLPTISDADVQWVSGLLNLPADAFTGASNDDPRLEALKSLRVMDVEACPGSGKTTLLVAKLGVLSRYWMNLNRGICVLSHTNVARREIEEGLGSASDGQRIMRYPHFVGTIHSFVNEFLALPWLRSKGYTIRAIDDDICLSRRWATLRHATRVILEKAGHDANVLRIKSADFSIGDVRWGRRGNLSQDSELYRLLVATCRSATEQGFFCHDEMFVWANELLDKYPLIARGLRTRFPLLFIDEVQDNSEAQAALLHRVFSEGSDPVVRQRFGDMNQAIFGYTGQEEAATDPFPAQSAIWPIPNSHRFGQQIADFANRFGITPQQLVGNGPSGTLIQTDTAAKHTIFLFEDPTLPNVLQAYGHYLVEIFSQEELEVGTFTAVGAVHRTGEDSNRPKYVGHYWPGYDHELTAAEPRPSSLFQHVVVGRKNAEEAGESWAAVQGVAEAILRLARLMSPLDVPSSRRRCHLQLLELLVENDEARLLYLKFQGRVSFSNAMPDSDEWRSKWVPALSTIARAISKSAPSLAATAFLKYPLNTVVADATSARDNIFRHPATNPLVKIRVGSIHSVKGETHTATLVLDTFYYRHNLVALKPWLLGQRSGGAGEGDRNRTRLKQHYVAMTRPTHLLCLAMRESEFSAAELDVLRARGWRLARVTTDGTSTWI